MNKTYLELVQYAVERAQKSGADAAEAFISDSKSVKINVSNREIEGLNYSNDLGIGLRILRDDKMIEGSSNDLSKHSVNGLIEDLLKKVVFHTPDAFNIIPESSDSSGEWSKNSDLLAFDPKIQEVHVKEKIKRALMLEASGLDFSNKIIGSMMTVYQDGSSTVYIANSNGICGWFPSSGCGGFTYLSAAEGDDHQSGSHSFSTVRYDDFNPEKIGNTAAENAIVMLGAQPIDSCEIPMVIDPTVSSDIIAYIVGMLSADQIQKGKSLFAEKLDTSVASEIFTLIDDGVMKGRSETSPVDGEGIPRQTTPLIVDGVLKSYLYDSYTANKDRVKSTGNRSRESFSSPGMIANSNLYIKQGDREVESIISGISRGFYLKDAIGLHAGIDGTSGDFSIPVAGLMIEGGKKTFPIRGITIGGNLFELLSTINQIGNDLSWNHSIGSPTLGVEKILIGGSS